MVIDLIQNTALLITLSVIHGLFVRFRKNYPYAYKLSTGFWFGLVAVAGMMMPFVYEPGAIFDGRSIVLTLAGLFGGGIAAIISATIAGIYRLYLGGAGVWAGVATIVCCSILGLIFRNIYKQKPEEIKLLPLFGIGLVVHFTMLACQLLFPWPMGLEILSKIWLPVILVFPVAFVIMSLLLGSEERRIKREQIIKEAESLFRTTLYSIGDAVITTDKGSIIERMNPVAESLTGWNESDAKGKSIQSVFRIIYENTRHEVKHPLKTAIDSGAITEFSDQMLLINKEEKEIPITDSGAPIINDDGAIIGAVVVFRDQTEERLKQKQLEESEEQFRKLFEDHAAVLLLIDPETGQIENANKAAVKYYGWTLDELKQMKIYEINTLSAEEIQKAIYSANIGSQLHFEFKHRLSNGEIRDVEVYSTRINIKGKAYLYSIIHDITEKKQLLKDIITAKEKAEENDRLKSSFLANMSHEIRTPLNGILGFSSLLTQERVPSKLKREQYSDIIQQSAENLMQIIDDILDISKLETGQFTVKKKKFELNQLLTKLNELYAKKLHDKNKQHLAFKLLMPNNIVNIETDENRLFQIFTNLLDNALKFTNTGGITFGYTRIADNFLEFIVKDSGIGIPENKQEVIFEHFRQADDSISINYGGTGLGLAIVKKLLHLLGGDIHVFSEPDKGTEFKFYLPYNTPIEITDDDIKSEFNLQSSSLKLKILIVEDDPVSRIYLSEILNDTKLELHIATNGEEALLLEKKHAPDVILMDIRLPDINGLELAKEIRKHNQKVKIIAQTAYAKSSDEKEALAAGCNAYLSKPIVASVLYEKLIN